MSSSSAPLPDREDRLDEAVAAYLEAVERGEQPDRGAWLARYPDLAAELAEFIDDQHRVHVWTSPLRDARPKRTPRETAIGDPLAGGDPLATLHVPSGAVADARRRFPNYQLLDEIARGGMGIVYRARQLNPNRIVALKMILAGPHASPAELYRFRMETEAAASLDHPHIMPIYEVGEQEGRPFFSMKLMEGGTLAEHLAHYAGEGRPAAELLIKVARAVHHAHQRGILHRDLKPANILLDAQGEPFVTDFGLCRRVEVDSGMTQSGVIVGTPSYMSPEQAAGRKGLTTATDVYSLGAVLYALLTDRPPFRGDTPLETVRGVLEDEPSRPRLLRPQVDRDLETICLKCLDKQPERRYRSAEAVAEDLARWLAGEPIVARRSSVWERTWKLARRKPTAAALVAVSSLALSFLIAAGVIYQNQRISVAEQALANSSRVERTRSDASSHIWQASALLPTGDAHGARLNANLAFEQAKSEPQLRDLARRAEELLAKAERQIESEQARATAIASVKRFEGHRDDVLCYGSPFASELPANLQAAQEAAAAALGEIGLSPRGEGSLRLSPALTGEERRSLAESCYELLLVLADQSARQASPDPSQAALLQQRASELRASLPATTAQEHFLRGYDARRQGELLTATHEFEEAIRVRPRHVWARCFLAACYLPTNSRVAEVHLTNLLDQRPDLYLAYLLRGIAHANLNEVAQADADFSHALARAPAQPHANAFRHAALAIRGNLRNLRGDINTAEQDLLEANRLKPDAHVALLYLAQTYERSGRNADAAKQLERALAANDLTPPIEAGILLYRASLTTRDPKAALADIHRLLALYPYSEAQVFLADERLRQKDLTSDDYDAVVEYCDYALASPTYSLAKDPGRRAHYLRAYALVELGRYEAAAETLDRYLAAGGRPSGEIQRLRGSIRAWHKDFPSAIHLFGESLKLDPGNPDTLAQRGSVYLAIGALDLALADFRAALAKDDKNANALAGRGLVRALRGDHEGAEEDAERAWALGPQTQRYAWMAARTLAVVHSRLQSRGRFVSVEESKSMVRYRQRAVALVEQALLRTPPDERPKYWRDAIEADAWLSLLRDQPAFQQLQRKYAPAVKPAPAL